MHKDERRRGIAEIEAEGKWALVSRKRYFRHAYENRNEGQKKQGKQVGHV